MLLPSSVEKCNTTTTIPDPMVCITYQSCRSWRMEELTNRTLHVKVHEVWLYIGMTGSWQPCTLAPISKVLPGGGMTYLGQDSAGGNLNWNDKLAWGLDIPLKCNEVVTHRDDWALDWVVSWRMRWHCQQWGHTPQSLCNCVGAGGRGERLRETLHQCSVLFEPSWAPVICECEWVNVYPFTSLRGWWWEGESLEAQRSERLSFDKHVMCQSKYKQIQIVDFAHMLKM